MPSLDSGFYRMTPFEAATGWLTGETPAIPVDAGPADTADPIVVLESLLVSALAHPPCVVAFSGGRDSSALLAVATRLATREGLPAPAAVTLRYASERPVEEEGWVEEARWQERVVRYLGVADWERIPVGDDADLLGPVAAERLLRHGLLWPPASHTTVPVLRLAPGGTVITGDGGDEIFGERRTTPLVRLLSGRRPRNRVEAAQVGLATAPRGFREREYVRSLRTQLARSWLRPAAQDCFARRVAADLAAEPVSWAKGIARLPRLRAWSIGTRNQDLIAQAEDARYLRPLQEPQFLAALGWRAPRWGFVDRDAAMRKLFGAFLPVDVLTRSTKALFNRVVFGEQSRAFVARWSGGGVPHELVDAERLRDFWTARVPHALSFSLLQGAWLAQMEADRGYHARGRAAHVL